MNDIFSGKVCAYCTKKTEYVDSSVIYGKSYGMIYLCRTCRAYVGVHRGTDNALGRVANSELRYWRGEAHKYFDRTWKNMIGMSRNQARKIAYEELSKLLGKSREETHIAYFDVDECKFVVDKYKRRCVINAFSLIFNPT